MKSVATMMILMVVMVTNKLLTVFILEHQQRPYHSEGDSKTQVACIVDVTEAYKD